MPAEAQLDADLARLDAEQAAAQVEQEHGGEAGRLQAARRDPDPGQPGDAVAQPEPLARDMRTPEAHQQQQGQDQGPPDLDRLGDDRGRGAEGRGRVQLPGA